MKNVNVNMKYNNFKGVTIIPFRYYITVHNKGYNPLGLCFTTTNLVY